MSELVSDEALMQQFCAGNAQAFSHLYARHEKPLYRFVRRFLGAGLAAQTDEAVSYTHLDVYKRQGISYSTERWA